MIDFASDIADWTDWKAMAAKLPQFFAKQKHWKSKAMLETKNKSKTRSLIRFCSQVTNQEVWCN